MKFTASTSSADVGTPSAGEITGDVASTKLANWKTGLSIFTMSLRTIVYGISTS